MEETAESTGASSAGNDTNQQQSPAAAQDNAEIRDPAAFYKAEAEKHQRLHRKAEETAAALQKQLEQMTAQQQQQMQQQIDAIKAETEATKKEAAEAVLNATKMQALAAKGLPAEEFIEFLDGITDPEKITARVEKLAAKLPQRGAGTSHKTGNGASGATLTMDEIRNMTPAQIAKRKPEVDAVLRSQK